MRHGDLLWIWQRRTYHWVPSLQRSHIPDTVSDEMMQAAIVATRNPLGDGRYALAITWPDQPRKAKRTRPPPRPVTQSLEKRLPTHKPRLGALYAGERNATLLSDAECRPVPSCRRGADIKARALGDELEIAQRALTFTLKYLITDVKTTVRG